MGPQTPDKQSRCKHGLCGLGGKREFKAGLTILYPDAFLQSSSQGAWDPQAIDLAL